IGSLLAGAADPTAQSRVAAHLPPVFKTLPIPYLPLDDFMGQLAHAHRLSLRSLCGDGAQQSSELLFHSFDQAAENQKPLDQPRGQLLRKLGPAALFPPLITLPDTMQQH